MSKGADASDRKAHGYVLLASLLVAGSFIASDRLAGQLHPIALTFLRFIIAALVLAPFVLNRAGVMREVISIFPRAFVLSSFYALFFIGMFEALTLTATVKTASIYTLVPLITALLAAFILKERIPLRRLLIYLVGAVGTLWVIFEGNIERLWGLALNRGDWIFLLASLSMCAYAVAMKSLYRQENLWLFVWCTLFGAMLWLGLAMLVMDVSIPFAELQAIAWWEMGYLALVTTLLTAYLYQVATVVLGPARVTAYVYINPILVAVIAWMFEGEWLGWETLPGVVISGIATFLLVARQPKQS